MAARVGSIASFRIVSHDMYGNMQTDGSDIFGWSVTREAKRSCAVSCHSMYNRCDDCDECSAILPIGIFATCVPDAKFSLQGMPFEFSVESGHRVQYVVAAAGLYTVRVWLATEQGNTSIWGSPWKHVRILDRNAVSLEDSSSSWDAVSDSTSGSWSSVEQANTDLNQSVVDGANIRVSVEGMYNITDASDSDSGSWLGSYGTESDVVANSSLETDQDGLSPADYTCAAGTSYKMRFDVAAYLEDSLFFVNILLNRTLSPALIETDTTDCDDFIASKSTLGAHWVR